MKTELLERLIMMLIDDEKSEQPQPKEKEMIGEYVIVRCRDAGVHAGYLKSYEGREVVLTNSRRLYYWKCANNSHSLSGVAENGIVHDKSKIPASVQTVVLPESCEILSITEMARLSIQGAPIHEVN